MPAVNGLHHVTAGKAWITFDCFGTLIDWNTGFASILAPLAGANTAALLRAYHRVERLVECQQPHRPYKDVLSASVLQAANEVGAVISEQNARVLPDSWGQLPVFADVEPMLAALRASDYRLAVLTNCDDDLFAQTHGAFARPFDMVITAQQVRDYKPSLTHFRRFAEVVRPDDWIHVACSWHHDIAPARRMGIKRIWLDRDRTGESADAASAHIHSAADVAAAIAGLS
jgi:2-haloacid dehalogenase